MKSTKRSRRGSGRPDTPKTKSGGSAPLIQSRQDQEESRRFASRVAAGVHHYVGTEPLRDRILSLSADTVSVRFLLAGVIGLLATLVYTAVNVGSLPPYIPLHFGSDMLPDQIGPRAYLLRLPAIGAVCLVADLALGLALHPREPYVVRVLLAGAILIQLFLLIASMVYVAAATGPIL